MTTIDKTITEATGRTIAEWSRLKGIKFWMKNGEAGRGYKLTKQQARNVFRQYRDKWVPVSIEDDGKLVVIQWWKFDRS